MTTHKNLYDVLGVSKDANAKTIKTAYRKLARKYHPDARPDDAAAEARFKEISNAYEVLGDAERRALYDEFGAESLRQGFDAEKARAWKEAQQQHGGWGGNFQGGNPFGAGGFQGGAGFDPSDLFGDLFGFGGRAAGGGRQMKMRGADAHAEVTLDFTAGAKGAQRELFFQDGRNLKVNIPSGVEDGETLRLRGKGAPGVNGGPAGDLLLTIHLTPHAHFRRDGLDLHLDLPITVKEAVQGARVRIPTLDGAVTTRVPAGTQSGQKLRLRGKGISRRGRGEGDLYVHLQVHVPEATSDEVARALDVLEGAYDANPRDALLASARVNA